MGSKKENIELGDFYREMKKAPKPKPKPSIKQKDEAEMPLFDKPK